MREWPNQPIFSSSPIPIQMLSLLSDSQPWICLELSTPVPKMIFVHSNSRALEATFDKVEDGHHYWGYHNGRSQEVHIAGEMYK